ncbi:HD-GYP domain-containing protein [Gottfriedia acidiceleris]|uniref:HD-GYP domain-containing protein n=1 Tax=Gottfriedia acidiceleris TaxID=371036 RepID=A0ABY4JM18_9BACI|nr:HD-GYP domain-containing protein [Gottfriedia acidiceleris]UPM53903.1 HD-GYP domain-containing protein [Gottfriedia acidiceleris]
MRVVEASTLVPGTILRKPLYNEHGKMIVSANIPLTEEMINRIHKLAIHFVLVHVQSSEQLMEKTIISNELRTEITKTIEDAFVKLISEDVYLRGLSLEKNSSRLKEIIKSLQKELWQQKDVLSLLIDVLQYDEDLFTHSLHVAMYSLGIGTALDLSKNQLNLLGLGALLHDVGKMFIPKKILNKRDRLTEDEYEFMKQHTIAGYEIIRQVPSIHPIVADCALQHHEKINGSGYPKGLFGEEMHLFSKIIGIADFFDAVTSNRVYRQAMLPNEGLTLLMNGIDKLYDAKLISIFSDLLTVYPTGLHVKLSDGRQGIVISQNDASTDRPVVLIIEENEIKLSNPYEVNLYNELKLEIIECDQILKKAII